MTAHAARLAAAAAAAAAAADAADAVYTEALKTADAANAAAAAARNVYFDARADYDAADASEKAKLWAERKVEKVAEAIYEKMEYTSGSHSPNFKPKWQPGGNSHKQEEARDMARAAIAVLAEDTP